jgi:hypothetical protein
MSDNFDVHSWKRDRLIESTLEDADLKAKKRVDIISNSVLKSFPELNKLELRYAISSGFSDLVFDGLLEVESNEKEYEVQYWVYRNDDYDNDEVTVKASNEEEALEKAKNSVRRGKNFKVIAIDGEYIKENTDTLSPIEETINLVLENIEGYSKYFPGGKTKGLDKDTLSTILMQIIKDTEEDGKQLDESTLCKRGQEYIKSRKAAGEKSSAYLSGRAVKVCKGDIKFKGKKQKDFKG